MSKKYKENCSGEKYPLSTSSVFLPICSDDTYDDNENKGSRGETSRTKREQNDFPYVQHLTTNTDIRSTQRDRQHSSNSCVTTDSLLDNPETPIHDEGPIFGPNLHVPLNSQLSNSSATLDPSSDISRCLWRSVSRPYPEPNMPRVRDTWNAEANRMIRMNTKILDAIQYKNNAVVQNLLNEGASANATCRAGHITACHAAASDNSEALHLLLRFDADANRKDKYGRTPLHLAAWAGDIRALAMLLDFSPELQEKLMQNLTSEVEDEIKQMSGTFTSEIEVPCKLPETSDLFSNWKDSIEHKCRNYMIHLPKFFSGWTPLHIASYAANHEAVKVLLAAGANPNTKDGMGRTPLDIAGAACYLYPKKVNVDEYLLTLKTLISFGGNLNVSDSTPTDSALHTAVKIGSVDAIQMLLNIGAPIWHQNDRGNTPLHECVKKLDHESLQILANHRVGDEPIRAIDVVNSSQHTVLHAAILACWVPGVCVALDAGALVTLKTNDGKTAIHLAALQGNLGILDEILLNAAQYVNAINDSDANIEPAIFYAIRSGNVECVRSFLDAGAELKMTYYDNAKFRTTITDPQFLTMESYELNSYNLIIHATAEAGSGEILQLLLEHDKNLEQLFLYECPYLNRMTPVEFAANHGNFDTFKFLLKRTMEMEIQIKKSFDHRRLLQIIASHNREICLDELLQLIPNAVSTLNAKTFFPLHGAAKEGHKNIIKKLIHHGADLSEKNETNQTAINLIVDNISKPIEFLETILDNYITTSNSTNSKECEINVDYRILIPETVNDLQYKGQMRVISAFLKNKNCENQRKLLAHPLIESFLYLKWKMLKTYFILLVGLYLLAVTSLSAFTLSIFYYRDKHNKTSTEPIVVPKIWNPEFWKYTVYITCGAVLIQELSCTTLSPETWFRRFRLIEFWIKCITIACVIITTQVISTDYEIVDGDIDWQRHLATVTLGITWLALMMLLSKTPTTGYYMQMFWEVSAQILKILVTFMFLILMFASCFMIEFHSHEPFEGPWASVVKTFVMMTSEFDYSSTFTRNNAKNLATSIQILRIVFIVFLFLTAIVLMNLTIGVAVHDVQNLLHCGNLKRLEKQVGFLNRLDGSREKKPFFHFLGLYRWFNCKKVPQKLTIKPINDKQHVYSTHIKKALIDKAEELYQKTERETELKKLELKMEMISNHIFDIKKYLRQTQSVVASDRKKLLPTKK